MATIRQHFVPQGYLRGFTESPESAYVWVYDKRDGRLPARKSVRSIAWAPSYYAQEHEDGSEDIDSVEKKFALTIDSEIPKIIKSLNSKPGELVNISEEDQGKLAFFIGISLTRVPSFRDGINDMYSSVASFALNQVALENEALAKVIDETGLTAEAKPWVSLRPMVDMANEIALSALSKNWQFFLPSHDIPFLTSDNPVLFSGGSVGLKHLGPAHPGAELVINLTKSLSLVCTPKKGLPSLSTFQLSPNDTRKFNKGIVRAARHRIFSNHKSEKIERLVKNSAGLEQRIIV
ncbi:DUF4238 domain-containing protein [Pseudomonas sp. VB3]|uniref:DUF4238 domain-containing protein n=1 Tax=Pseudomonas sp. VB3 TaxID=2994641 RepID=UPI0022EC9426|nr:DUF4238 domain-containing protein [Pseudomonas sp. VB3]